MYLHVLPDPREILIYSGVHPREVLSCTVNPEACDANHSVTITNGVGEESPTRVSITSISPTISSTELGSPNSDPGYCCVCRGARLLRHHGYLGLPQPVLWSTT